MTNIKLSTKYYLTFVFTHSWKIFQYTVVRIDTRSSPPPIADSHPLHILRPDLAYSALYKTMKRMKKTNYTLF